MASSSSLSTGPGQLKGTHPSKDIHLLGPVIKSALADD